MPTTRDRIVRLDADAFVALNQPIERARRHRATTIRLEVRGRNSSGAIRFPAIVGPQGSSCSRLRWGSDRMNKLEIQDPR